MDLELRKSAVLLADQEIRRRKALANVPKDDVDSFAGLYAEADRHDAIASKLRAMGHDVPDYGFLRGWLDEQLNIGEAREGLRARQVVEVEKGATVDDDGAERKLSPRDADGFR